MEEDLKPLVYDIVRQLQGQRISEGILPDFVPITDVLASLNNAVKSAANSLIKDGKLEWFKNVNGMVMLGVADDANLIY